MNTINLKKYLDRALEITKGEMYRRLSKIKIRTGKLHRSVTETKLYKRKEGYAVYYRSPRGKNGFPYAYYIDKYSAKRRPSRVLPTHFLDPLKKDFRKLKKDIAKATKKDIVAMIKEYKKQFKNIK